MSSLMGKKKKVEVWALAAAAIFLFVEAACFMQPRWAMAENYDIECKGTTDVGRVGYELHTGNWQVQDTSSDEVAEEINISHCSSGLPEGVTYEVKTDPKSGHTGIWFEGIPEEAGTYKFAIYGTAKFSGDTEKTFKYRFEMPIKGADDSEDAKEKAEGNKKYTEKDGIYNVWFVLYDGTVGDYFDCGRLYVVYKHNEKPVGISNVEGQDVPEGMQLKWGKWSESSFKFDENGESAVVKFFGTPKTEGNYVFYITADMKFEGVEDPVKTRIEVKFRVNGTSDDDDDDDDNKSSSDSGKSYEEKQAEAEREFAPAASTMTAEQNAGWSVVSREAPSVSSSGGGVSAVSAYQGPMCRLAFQMATPGYTLGHTYDMRFADKSAQVSMKVPSDLAKSGRKYVMTFVAGGGIVSTPELTADANGNISFNLASLGIKSDYNNAAVAIMYQD